MEPAYARLSDRDVWLKAGKLVAEHGAGAADHIISELGTLLGTGTRDEVDDWRRVAKATDDIADAGRQ